MATGTSLLDLVFAMDCTGSMASYIKNATDNIRLIVNEIVSKENVSVRLALIEYRDHPPQDTTFITRVHSFTDSVTEAKGWLERCSAKGGGDTPEAVADALNDALNLPWNSGAVKICILISDAPPHGLDPNGDTFPSGCPLGHDPLAIARKMAEKHITLYTAGVEPPILPYRDFFMTLTHITGGQYVPIVDANRLAQMIIAAVREEISLDRLMHSTRGDIKREMHKAATEKADHNETATRLQRVLNSKKLSVNRMNNAAGGPSKQVEECYSKCQDMADIQKQYKKMEPAANRIATDMDYKLEEQQAITIEQTKRIVQKAKNWDSSAEEPTTRRITPCKYGAKCHDSSSYHRATFSHPEHNDDLSTGRSHKTKSDNPTAYNQQTNSHNREDDRQTHCRNGVGCTDHSDYHRTKYSHDENDDHSTRRNQETNPHFRNDSHSTRRSPETRNDDLFSHKRETNPHFRNDSHSTRGSTETRSNDQNTRNRQTNSHNREDDHTTQCRNGASCTDQSDYHRTKYSHPMS